MTTLGHYVQIECMKSTQGHMLRSIPVVHSGNSAHSGKRTHRVGCSTTVEIFIVHQLQEKHLAANKRLYMAFIDLEKAFDHVLWNLVGNVQSRY